VVLNGILPEDYYQHHLLLVEGVYLLLQDVVEEKHVTQSSQLFKHYCYLFPYLYGKNTGICMYPHDLNCTLFCHFAQGKDM